MSDATSSGTWRASFFCFLLARTTSLDRFDAVQHFVPLVGLHRFFHIRAMREPHLEKTKEAKLTYVL